jgi:hypothetical protein
MSRKRNTSVPCIFGGAGQRACTVPTSTPNTVIRISSGALFYHRSRKVEMRTLRVPHFHPAPWNGGDFPLQSLKMFLDTNL